MIPTETHTDVLIVGGGPVGLYAAFYVGLRGLSVRVVEARPELGGQPRALYPEKFIYDAPGFAKVRGGELADALEAQVKPFSPALHVGELATGLRRAELGWEVRTTLGAYTARAVILTAGIGALLPRAANVPGAPEFGRVYTELGNAQSHADERVLVFGGVPQATRAALALHDAGARVVLAHRRALFRGTPAQLQAVGQLRTSGALTAFAPADLARFTAEGAELVVGGETRPLELDAAYVLNGYLPDLAPLEGWGLEWQGEYVVAGAGQGTNLPGVFVAGDLSSSGGDLKLLAAGFAEAAVAANHAAHFVRPELKVRPGHSSDKKLPA